jgi:hypothetical protein
MNQLIKLPSGMVVNLSLVSRIIPVADTLEVHFTGGDKAVLQGEDADAFRRKSSLSGSRPNKLKTAIFWVVMITVVLLLYLVVRSRG